MQIEQELPQILLENFGLMKEFKQNSYKDSFQRFSDTYRLLFASVEEAYKEAADKQIFLDSLAESFVKEVKNQYDGKPKKSIRDSFQIDCNMLMGSYVIPGMIEFKGESSEPLADTILEKWNTVFKQFKLQKGNFADIDGAFRRKPCYITTAVCDSLGKADDCYELSLLREYRDHYLMSKEEGRRLVDQYYEIAPLIVTGINQMRDAAKIYQAIYKQYLNPCITYIEQDEPEKCEEKYIAMVTELQQKYSPDGSKYE